jgi:hypothetical protein
MATAKTIYSVKPLDDERWAIEKKGAIRRSGVLDTRKDAIRRAKELALSDRSSGGVQLKIFDMRGKIEEELEWDSGGNLKKEKS